MLSILGGDWGGRTLSVPKSKDLRPSAGRVKAAIFSIIESYRLKQQLSSRFESCRVLDLFAGIGGLGLEALSRGADHAVFVEKDRRHADILKKNIAELGCKDRCDLLTQSVERFESWHKLGQFDLVFMDPPYALPNVTDLMEITELGNALAPGAIVIFEHGPKDTIKIPKNFTLHSARKLGPAGLSVFLYTP